VQANELSIIGSQIVSHLRQKILRQLKYTCSEGVAEQNYSKACRRAKQPTRPSCGAARSSVQVLREVLKSVASDENLSATSCRIDVISEESRSFQLVGQYIGSVCL
jgi:hypothetical protein